MEKKERMGVMRKGKNDRAIKCSPHFFNREDINEIRSFSGGETFVILYMIMLTVAVNSEGYIRYEGIGSSPEEEIALSINEDETAVRMTLGMLRKYGLVKACENGDYYFPEAAKNEIL